MTSVTALGANGRSASAASRLSVVIDRVAAASPSSCRRPSRAACSSIPVPSGFVRKSASPGRAPLFAQKPFRMHGADDREPVLRLVVAQRVPAGEHRAGGADLLVGGAEDRGERLVRQALGEGGDREREQRRAAHREDVVERVRRGDPAEERRIVDERREEVEREDERALVVELVDGGVVRGREPDEQVLGLGRDEAAQQLLEPRGRVLRRAAAARREGGEALGPRPTIRLASFPARGGGPEAGSAGREATAARKTRRRPGSRRRTQGRGGAWVSAPRFAILSPSPCAFLR